MMKLKKVFIFLILLVNILSITNFAEAKDNPVTLYFFYGQGCPHCAKMEVFLEDLSAKYPNLEIKRYETYFNQESRALFEKMSQAYGTEIKGVPATFINDKFIFGFNDDIGEQVEQEVKNCSENKCINPLDKMNGVSETPVNKLTIPAVISAAAVDAINPCEFAVLILLLTTILATHSRKKALLAGLAFSLAVYISYFLMGVGLYSAIHAAGMTKLLYKIVSVVAILIGLFNIKDYFWYGKVFLMEVPISWRPMMKGFIRRVTSVSGAFFVGFLVSLFLLPCTSGPYIVILGLLAEVATRNYALILLGLYNIIFVLPMLLITFAIYFGFTSTEQAEDWRRRKLKILHLVAGIILLLLGISMLIWFN